MSSLFRGAARSGMAQIKNRIRMTAVFFMEVLPERFADKGR
jgi:hypothetical protein